MPVLAAGPGTQNGGKWQSLARKTEFSRPATRGKAGTTGLGIPIAIALDIAL